MKRIQEKIKDLVEVRSYKSLRDFISNPEQTLSAYHFTDVTAEMMAKWLDKVAEAEPQNGQAKALAGYRGVGKSHFLGALGAIISHPEFRSRVTDGYVLAGAQRLKRRRYPVGYVRRGTHDTLFDEIREAVAIAFETEISTLPGNLNDLIEKAADMAGEVPFVLFVDTAFDRLSRVARDDGEPLGKLAELAKNLNVFIGVALDDDIAGADGVNAAIAMSYSIDYLDQEHLYRIIETNLFPKHRQTQHILHEIYTDFRESLPAFRWSEQRFTALYPLHPVILEVAPFIRLYDKNFVILEFASETATKSLGRPANSLVALDEVFDAVEKSLREAEDLKESFETYDQFNAEVIANIPLMQRLQAKLVLKALLILSLNGDGATAQDIGSVMLGFQDGDPANSIKIVGDILETFYQAKPDQINRNAEEGREVRYGFKVNGKDGINVALAEKSKNVSDDTFEKILRRFGKDRYSDWLLPVDAETPAENTADCHLHWRGGLRRGRVVWNWKQEDDPENVIKSDRSTEFIDWEVLICNPEQKEFSGLSDSDCPLVIWQPDSLKPEEIDTIRRYHVLLNDDSLRNDFGEQVRAAGHTHHTQIEKIWKRVFIDDGKLLIDGFEYDFFEEAKFTHSISELFSIMLMPLFEARYQQHPYFACNLGMGEVSSLVNEHFSGAKISLPEVQELARDIAFPLGLVVEQGNSYVLESDERLNKVVVTKEVLDLVSLNENQTVSLRAINQILKKEPFGLPKEAQHIVLGALVAQRKLEFVTSKGDRINRRSLDLKIIWDDIVGVAAPQNQLYGSVELTKWAKVLTGLDNFQTIDNPSDRETILHALKTWFDDWQQTKLLERFEALPDEVLNTTIWKLARHAQNTFGAVAGTVEYILGKTISLDEGLQRVADAFSDSEEEFYSCAKDLVVLEDFISGLSQREKIWEYLAVCEATQDSNIESLRHKLLGIIEQVTAKPSELLNRELENTWNEFYEKFSSYFAINHDAIMKSHLLQEKIESVMKSDEWWEFENLSRNPIFHDHHRIEAEKICRQFKELDCGFDVKEMLKLHPFCACSFSLFQISEWEILPAKLMMIVEKGREGYRHTLRLLKEAIIPSLEDFIENGKDKDFVKEAQNLVDILEGRSEFRLLNHQELIILNKIIQNLSVVPLLNVNLPIDLGFQTRTELQTQLNDWIIELPSEPCLLKI